MSLLAAILFVLGFGLLVGGAELLIRGASRLAVSIGLSPLVVGLTVVAFGTSAPELAVTLRASTGGAGELAVGNVFGSNISNVLLVLGTAAVVAPLVVHTALIRRDVPVMIAASATVLLLALDGSLGRWDGVVLLAGALAYTVWVVHIGRRQVSFEYAADLADEAASPGPWWLNLGVVVVGLTMLVVGAEWLVGGAKDVAEELGLSELVVGLTIVAVGTSLPELATSVVATVRGEREIVAGNVVGSNLYNLLLVLGAGALVSADGLPVPASVRRFDGPVMLAVAVACLPVFFDRGIIRRWEGVVFVGYYAAYLAYLLLDATDHDALGAYRGALLGFAVPLTVLTLAVVTVRRVREGQGLPRSERRR